MSSKQDHAASAFAALFDGTHAPSRREGWHVETATHGRVRVATRSNAVRHTNWYTVSNLDRCCDRLLLAEFDVTEQIAGAWLLDQRDIQRFGRRSGARTKFAMFGPWRTPDREVELG